MEFKGINFRKIEPKVLLSDGGSGGLKTITSKEFKNLLKIIEEALDAGAYMVALNSILLGIKLDYEKTFSAIRKKGLFRYSRYIQKKCIIDSISKDLLRLHDEFNLLVDRDKTYLQSVVNLTGLHISFNTIHKLIIEEIAYFLKHYKGASLIKTLLAFSDVLFLTHHMPEDPSDRLNVKSRTKEEIAEAVSFLIYFISSRQEVRTKDITFVADELITSGVISRIIIPVCAMIDLKELEILVESFDYSCIVISTEKLKIIPPSEEFDKSIRLGYIRSELQLNSYVDEFNGIDIIDEAVSMEGLIDAIKDTVKDNIKFHYKEDFGYGRYVLEFPEDMIDALVEHIFKPNTFNKEDLMYLSVIFKEQLITFDDIEETIIREKLTIQEFINIRRLFIFLFSLYRRQLYDHKDEIGNSMLFRSIIPAFPEDGFYKLFGKITTPENLDTFLDIMCWEPGSDNIFDLQYHPLLYIDGHFLVPLSIFSHSNAIRNLYASEHKSNGLLMDGKTEPLSAELYDSFKNAGLQCLQNVNFPNGDVDALAIVDKTLYIFECKHTLHPINTYDLRTTFDHIQKAETQLDKIKEEYESGNLKKIIEAKLGLSLDHICNVSYSIVLSNKLFSGNSRKYPIRHINELTNVIEEGRFKTNDGIYCVWNGENMTSQDLDSFLGVNNTILNIFFDSLSVTTFTYPLTLPIIEMDRHYLDSEVILPKVKVYTDSIKQMV